MSLDPYSTHLTDIKDKLVDIIQTTSSFASNTWADYVKKVSSYPVCFVRLRNDMIDDIGPAETRHLTTFTVQVENRGSYDEANLDLIIAYVGQIIDAIEANRTMSSSHVANSEITGVDYTLRNDNEAVFHYAHITVVVSSLRNV